MSGSTYRRPRLQVLANGQPVAGAERAEVTSNGYQQADRFHVTVVIGPDATMTPAWWSDNADVTLDIRVGMLADGAAEGTAAFTSLLIGAVDKIDIDLIEGRIELTGRDKSALLIDTKTQETFANKTSSQIATILAGRHGLTPNVTATSKPVGQYYELEHDHITLGNFSATTTDWDLLAYLARLEGFDVWVSGNVLNFGPPPTGGTPFPLVFQAGAAPSLNAGSLVMERSLTLARDVQVTVKSWRSADSAATTRVVRAPGANNVSTGAAQNYDLTCANKTPQEALVAAQQYLAALTRQERILRVTMPGELTLNTRSQVSLSGTGTAFDQTYFVAEIERTLSWSTGFEQTLRLKNSSPRSTVVER